MLKEPLLFLPVDFQENWGAMLQSAQPTTYGAWRLVDVRRTVGGAEDLKVIVKLIDENGYPVAGQKVAFQFSTAPAYKITEPFRWQLPMYRRADVFATGPAGMIEHVQGSTVKKHEPGGISVFIFDPMHASDIVVGTGALADHTGMVLTYQLQRTGIKPFQQQIDEIWEYIRQNCLT